MNKISPLLRQSKDSFTNYFRDSGGIIESIHFSRNEVIYREDEDAHSWYEVVSGTVRACNLLADGRRHVAAFFFAGDFFGFDESGTYLASTEAVNNVTLTRYPRAALKHLSSTNPSLAQILHNVATKNVGYMCRRMTLLARKTALERVASFLLDMANRNDGGNCVDLPMTRHDIADHLGLTFETVCRAISAMKRLGAIKLLDNSHQIDLIDYAALKSMQAGDGFVFSTA